jgi:hypothetical protein
MEIMRVMSGTKSKKDKLSREERLAQSLRDNLRRRKQASRKIKTAEKQSDKPKSN